MNFTRGFKGRGQASRDPRLPPGQYVVGSDWPVLTAEATPTLSTDTWTFWVGGLVDQPMLTVVDVGNNAGELISGAQSHSSTVPEPAVTR
jgi:hypothetical protein